MDWKVHQWTETKWSASRGKWITECLLCPVDFSQDVISHRKLHFSPFVTLNKLVTEEERAVSHFFKNTEAVKTKKSLIYFKRKFTLTLKCFKKSFCDDFCRFTTTESLSMIFTGSSWKVGSDLWLDVIYLQRLKNECMKHHCKWNERRQR